MKISLPILIISIILLASCHPNSNEATESNNSHKNTAGAPNLIERINLTEQKCQVLDGRNICYDINIKTNQFDNKQLNNFIFKTLTNTKTLVNGDLKPSLINYLNERIILLQKEEENNNYHVNYLNEKELSATGSNKNFISFRYETEEYQGGAHPDTNVNNYVIDSNNMTILTLQDILIDENKTDTLLELQKNVLYQALLNKNIEQAEVDENMRTWDIKVSVNWRFNQGGITFTYSPYEAGPYYYGSTEITLSKEQLQGIIKPKYLKLIDSWQAYPSN